MESDEFREKVRTKFKERKRKKKKSSKSGPSDWSSYPYVTPGAIEDFGSTAGEKYEGGTLETAQADFAKEGLVWDEISPAEFKDVIKEIRKSRSYSDRMSSACFVFCQTMIPAEHRDRWMMAVSEARDQHESSEDESEVESDANPKKQYADKPKEQSDDDDL